VTFVPLMRFQTLASLGGCHILAPIASMMVRAFVHQLRVAGVNTAAQIQIVFESSRTFPPRRMTCATQGICIRLIANDVQMGRRQRLTMASR